MALTLNTFLNLGDFYRLNFIINSNLNDLELCVVVPNPKIADHLRLRFKEVGSVGEIKVESISTFLRKKLNEENCKKSVFRKSDILLHLTSVWNHFFPEASYALFSQAYEIFSDWRSFSLDLNIFDEALESLDPIIKKAVVFFWKYIETADFYDEHGAYDFLSKQELKTTAVNYIFYGFAHLSGAQIAMLKNLGNKTDVFLPIPLEVLENSQYSDWPNWIETRILKQGNKKEWNLIANELKCISYDSQSLNQLVPDLKGEALLLGDQSEFNYVQELQGNDYFIKSNYAIAEDRFISIADQLQEYIDENNNLEVVVLKLEEKKVEVIKNKKWIDLKILDLFLENLKYIKNTVSEITPFVSEIILTSTRLNLPRTYLITLAASEENVILGADYLWAPKENGLLNLIVKDSDTIFSSGSVNYSATIYKVLSSVGPILRAGLRRDWLQFNLKDQLRNRAINLYVSHETLEINPWWKEVAKLGTNLDFIFNNSKQPMNWEINAVSKAVRASFSASEIQTYCDCPRKYYVQYIEKLDPRVINEKDLSASEIGTIEHDFIKNYCETENEYIFENVKTKAFEFVDQAILKLNRKVDLLRKEIITEEVINYTADALELIYYLQKSQGLKFIFEKEFKDIELKIHGRIDCYFKNNEMEGVLDFKRSKVPTLKEVLSFNNWQLWVYVLGLNSSHLNQTFGFLNLAEKNKSWVISEKEWEITDEIKNTQVDLQALKNLAKEKILEIIQAISTDSKFEIKPRNSSVCVFCPANFFCPRKALN